MMNPQDPNGWTTPKQKTEDRTFAENLLNELETPARKARRAQKKHGRKSAARLKVKR